MSKLVLLATFVAGLWSCCRTRHGAAAFSPNINVPITTKYRSFSSLYSVAEANIADVSSTDKSAIQKQLGYVPPNLIGVSARRHAVDKSPASETNNDDTKNSDASSSLFFPPVALKCYPLGGGAGALRRSKNSSTKSQQQDATPFPTLYWLCCPKLSRAIAGLERQGYVRILQQRIDSNPTFVRNMYLAHELYGEERWNALSAHDQQLVQHKLSPRVMEMLRYSGVGGTEFRKCSDKNVTSSLKCLHVHYAFYRSFVASHSSAAASDCSGWNEEQVEACTMVGKWIDELLLEQFPECL